MTDLAIEWVPAGEHTAEDLEHIAAADEAQPVIERISLLHMDNALRKGLMQMFRLKPGPGVLVTEVRQQFGHKRLSLIRGAGSCQYNMKRILHLLGQYATELGCECVETVVYSERLEKALLRYGAVKEGAILTYTQEAQDGR